MHVLVLAPGGSIHSRRYVDMLLGGGHRVTVVDSEDPHPTPSSQYAFIAFPGIEQFPTPDVRGARFILRPLDRIRIRQRASRLRKIWREIRPDVVHVQWIDRRAEMCARAGMHPLVYTGWGTDINFWFSAPAEKHGPHRRRELGWTIGQADYITSDSTELLHRCELLAGKAVPTQLCFTGIDVGYFEKRAAAGGQAIRDALGIPQNARILLSVRSMREMMGHHDVLEAFGQVAAEFPDTVLVFKRYAPYFPDYEARLATRAKELNVSDRIFWQEDMAYAEMPAMYAMAHLVINYPTQDAFPVTFFEASASRARVVTAKLPAYVGVFGDAFLTVAPMDPNALAEGLRAGLTEAPAEREKKLDQALQTARRVGDERSMLSVIEGVFAKVASR